MLRDLTPVITILLCIYLVADILIPAFTNGNFFWFIKGSSFKSKTAEEELADAEKSFNEAFETLKNVSISNTEQYEKAKQVYEAARNMYDKAKDVYDKMKNDQKQ